MRTRPLARRVLHAGLRPALRAALAAALLVAPLGAPPRAQTPLPPPGFIVIVPFIPVPSGLTLLASMVQALSPSGGSVASAVYRTPGGTLDFFYQLSGVAFGLPLPGFPVTVEERLTTTGFTGFAKSAAQLRNPLSLPGAGGFVDLPNPESLLATRDAIGASITWELVGAFVRTRTQTPVFGVVTDATAFNDLGSFTVRPSGSPTAPMYSAAIFAPTALGSTVPEPDPWALLATGLLGVRVVARERRRAG
jgi:hypothetical protein